MTKNKVALVTGSGGERVGRSIVAALADRGYRLAIHYYRSAGPAAELADELRARNIESMTVQANLAVDSEATDLVDQVVSRFGRLDVLVNCAAIWRAKKFEDVTAADVRLHFELNTLSTFLCSQRAGLQMAQQEEGGNIITIGDWATERPYRDYAAYFPSKGAIPALTRSLAVELAYRNPRVRVNCILPGPVMLPPEVPDEERQRVVQSTLVKREGRPQNVAQAVVFLIENDYVTGICLPVDGGRTIYAGD